MTWDSVEFPRQFSCSTSCQFRLGSFPMSVAHRTQRLLLVLTISNLQSSMGVMLLFNLFIQCLASIVPSVVVAMATNVAVPVFCHRKSKGW
jgi:hypothetical protein